MAVPASAAEEGIAAGEGGRKDIRVVAQPGPVLEADASDGPKVRKRLAVGHDGLRMSTW